MTADIESARRDWDDGRRRLELASRDETQAARLRLQLDTIVAELRRRVGSTFTVAQLAAAYAGVDTWARQVIEESAPTPGWARSVAIVSDAAFHEYQRGALDYAP